MTTPLKKEFEEIYRDTPYGAVPQDFAEQKLEKLKRFIWLTVFFLPCWVVWSITRSLLAYWDVHKEIADETI